MAYQPEPFPYSMDQQPSLNLYYPHPTHPLADMAHPPHADFIYPPYSYNEYPDFMPAGVIQDEFDDGGEATTRPRLTKEQAEVLETQFQAHPKPNGVVKRQLAMQTHLSLPRVANWFQNRRAKAKQQRKQEEFEIIQARAVDGGWKNDGEDDQGEKNHSGSIQATTQPSLARPDPPSRSPSHAPGPAKEEVWDSMQRALGADKAAEQNAARRQRAREQVQAMMAMPPPELPRPSQPSALPFRQTHDPPLQSIDWTARQNALHAWSSPPAATQNIPFDFDFYPDTSASAYDAVSESSPNEVTQQTFVVAPEHWGSALATPTFPGHGPGDFGSLAQSTPPPLPSYPSSRRGSAAEALTANFESFALAGSSPHRNVHPAIAAPLRHTEGEIDIAGRRKRPRPAALTAASLRSRSSGQLTSVSPTIRPGMTPPAAHTIRHVKSTGHSLNNYAGIRKASVAQKSPLNISFAEAEYRRRLMAKQAAAAAAAAKSQSMPVTTEVCTSGTAAEITVNMQHILGETGNNFADMMAQYQNMYSPPTTPFQPEFMYQTTSSGMPSVSAPAQYATFADYTPPYSAGPLTNSSWSDAPLTSPELAVFPPVTYIPSMTYAQQHDGGVASFQPWMLPSDNSPESCVSTTTSDSKKTEFFIQEFPGQKEEHASVAQQLAQQKPKHYVFANSKPSDYD